MAKLDAKWSKLQAELLNYVDNLMASNVITTNIADKLQEEIINAKAVTELPFQLQKIAEKYQAVLGKLVFEKSSPESKIWLVSTLSAAGDPVLGEWQFSFDKEKIYNFYTDYPSNMTPEEVEIFNKEFPNMAADKKSDDNQ
ncbi:MAG: hypothetical protein LUD24_02820 [Phascolarctobacterium sp.]|nr:hypothetical protein [Phascolarctobacterium sp.]